MIGRSDESIAKVCRAEGRALLTFDQGFAKILVYPPEWYHGPIVLRLRRQDRAYFTAMIQRCLPGLTGSDVSGQLLIVDESGIRWHGMQTGNDAETWLRLRFVFESDRPSVAGPDAQVLKAI